MTVVLEYSAADLDTVARTLWGECRGEPRSGQVAVAWVIRNRAQRTAFAGALAGHAGAAAAVCRKPLQFSCWNPGDPNRARLIAMSATDLRPQLKIADDVLADTIADPTQGADHYHTIDPPPWAEAWPPYWAASMRETARFGGHVFYDSRSRP